MPDGKPDLSGTWQPEANPYRFNLIQQLKDESIFRPAAQAVFLTRVADFRRDDPVTNCLPAGPSEMLSAAYRIMQSPAVLAVLYESPTGRYRQIYMDGRQLPDDPNPSWLGYSVGRWEGDTLVVESAGFNDRTWLDRAGHPHSEKLRVTERFRRVDFGHLQYQITFDDPRDTDQAADCLTGGALQGGYGHARERLQRKQPGSPGGDCGRRCASQLGRARQVRWNAMRFAMAHGLSQASWA